MRWRRMVAMKSGTWRSGRSGGASGSVTRGKRSRLDMPGAIRRRGGKSSPLGDQESVSCDAHRGVVMESDPSPSLEVAEPDFLLEFEIIALDAPPHHRDVDEPVERDVARQCREPELRRLRLVFRPLDQQPFLGLICRAAIAARANAHASIARLQRLGRALPPRDRLPCAPGQIERQGLRRGLLLALGRGNQRSCANGHRIL